MSSRRRYLLSCINLEKYVATLFPNVFFNVVDLPADYQEVEYIESSGTQYFDKGVL